MKIKTLRFVNISSLISEDFASSLGFYEELSSNAPFSWGDNDITLVTAGRLLDHVRDSISESAEKDALMKTLEKLGKTFINLEG